ncbi:MAG TPA: nucleotidyltransferase family protein [Vicinamibacterales bacterium]|jgi:hypothetical protein|nr:nucleotidyltransferase family protein [Vicinamibacterales bacterium]
MKRELCALVAGGVARPEQRRLPDLVALARTERVHLIVAQRLAGDAPEELRNEARVEAVRDTLRVRELVRVVSALEAGGCAPVVFKGAALGLTHYQESWLRPRLDADLLVDLACRVRAAATLAALGYERPAMTSGRYVMHQEMHVRPDPVVGEHVVDLHWKLANPNLLTALPTHAELRGRAAAVAAPGGLLHVASPADALVIACVHRAAHHAASDELLWLYDIHLVSSRLTAEEWATTLRVAACARVTAMVRTGLELAARAFGPCAPPAPVLETLVTAAPEPSAVFLRRDLRRLDRLRADVAALGAAGGARLIAEHLFPPASYMREKYGLRRGAQLPFAYARRIVGGASAWFKRN